MPQISSNHIGHIPTDQLAHTLHKIAIQLEREICNALLADNVALAERLVAPQTQLKKLSQSIAQRPADISS